MRVVVAGETPFAEAIAALCRAANHQTTLFLVEDFLDALEADYDLDALANAEIAIELHNESAAAKQELLLGLAGALPEDALIMTSALATSTTLAASWVPNPERVVGFGVIPPLVERGVVELAGALQTDEAALVQADLFWRGLGQETMVVRDGPGLVKARTIAVLVNEAVSLVMEGYALPSEIDRAIQTTSGLAMGPLAWGDLIGLDAVLGILTGLQEEWGDGRYRPSPLLRQLVQAGRLGKKSGRGFFTYN